MSQKRNSLFKKKTKRFTIIIYFVLYTPQVSHAKLEWVLSGSFPSKINTKHSLSSPMAASEVAFHLVKLCQPASTTILGNSGGGGERCLKTFFFVLVCHPQHP